jgi:hypothetical protein
MSVDARSRAAEVLSVPVDTTAGAATRAFLAGLPTTDFVPSGESVAALNTLVGLAIPTDADNASLTLREEVEEFARRYWSLAPEDRLTAWLALNARSPDDSTATRLLTLEAGLKLPGTPFLDSAAERIVAIARELYVLPHRERAIRRNEWLLANAARHKELIAIAATLQKSQAAFAALDPVLFARLSPQFDARVFANAATASPLPERSHSPSEPIVYHPPIPRQETPNPRHSGSFNGWTLAIGAVLSLAFRVLFLPPDGTTTTPKPFSAPPSSPEYRYPIPDSSKTPLMPNSGSRNYFTPAQVEQCLEFEKKGMKDPVPLHYPAWVLACKPKAYENTYEKQSKGSGLSQPQPSADFSPENIRRFREYALNPNGTAPQGFLEWVEAGQPDSLP